MPKGSQASPVAVALRSAPNLAAIMPLRWLPSPPSAGERQAGVGGGEARGALVVGLYT